MDSYTFLAFLYFCLPEIYGFPLYIIKAIMTPYLLSPFFFCRLPLLRWWMKQPQTFPIGIRYRHLLAHETLNFDRRKFFYLIVEPHNNWCRQTLSLMFLNMRYNNIYKHKNILLLLFFIFLGYCNSCVDSPNLKGHSLETFFPIYQWFYTGEFLHEPYNKVNLGLSETNHTILRQEFLLGAVSNLYQLYIENVMPNSVRW